MVRSAGVFSGLAIGFCIVVGGFAIGPISGGSLNPAVSLAIDTSHSIHGGKRWLNCVAYSAFEVVGASIAAGLYYVASADSRLTEEVRKCDQLLPM